LIRPLDLWMALVDRHRTTGPDLVEKIATNGELARARRSGLRGRDAGACFRFKRESLPTGVCTYVGTLL
jgi:hypothetical protein